MPDGCDSITTLLLTVDTSATSIDVHTACDSYTWIDGITFTASNDTATFTFANDTGCDSVVTLNLTLYKTPALSLEVDTVCDSLEFVIHAETDAELVTWISEPSDSAAQPADDWSLTVKPVEPTVYTAYASDNAPGLCGIAASIELQLFEPLRPAIKVTPSLLPHDASQFTAYDATVGEADWRRWYIDGIEQADDSSPLHGHYDNEADSVVLHLVVGDRQCTYSASTTLKIAHFAIWAPNIFTPDHETNNIFTIITIGVFEPELRIYDRNGLLVFATDDLQRGWDGTSNGRRCAQGAYVWKLHYRQTDYPKRQQVEVGTVTLLR